MTLLAACWTSTPVVAPTPPPTDPEPPATYASHRPSHYRSPCELAIDHIVEVAHDEIDKIPDLADRLGVIRDAGVASCNETTWAADALRCFEEAVESSDLGRCEGQLTPDQTSDLMRRMTEVMSASP